MNERKSAEELFERTLGPLFEQMGVKREGLFSRYTQFVDELAKFVIHQSAQLFPEQGLAPVMAAMAAKELCSAMSDAILNLLMERLSGPIIEHINRMDPQRIVELTGGQVKLEDAREMLDMAKSAISNGKFDPEAFAAVRATRGQRPN